MQDLAEIDELELELINALQLNPRAPWSVVGSVLGVDPVTVARRWERLAETGLSWIVTHRLHPAVSAFVEVGCTAGQAEAVADRLCRDHRVSTVEHITGDSDLLLTVFVDSLTELSSFVLRSVGAIPGVRTCRSHLATAIHIDGSRWQLGALTAGQRTAILASRPTPDPAPAPPLDTRDLALLRALELDGRADFTRLGRQTALSTSTARRRITSMLSNRSVVMRCEVAQPFSGWPVGSTLWCRVAPHDLDRVAKRLARLPETRLCASVTGGRANLVLTVWLRSPGDVHRLQSQLAQHVRSLEILDIAVALRHAKRFGHMLDEHGRGIGFVPMTYPASSR